MNLNYTYLNRKVELNLLVLLVVMLVSLQTMALGACTQGQNKSLQSMKTLLQSSVSAPKKSHVIADKVDMDVFAENTLPKSMLAKATTADKQQMKIFLRNALERTLFKYFNNHALASYQFHKTFCMAHGEQLLLGGSYSKNDSYIPLTFNYNKNKNKHWQLVDIGLYTTFLTSAYNVQLQNWLEKQSFRQIMMAIRKQNAILLKKQKGAS